MALSGVTFVEAELTGQRPETFWPELSDFSSSVKMSFKPGLTTIFKNFSILWDAFSTRNIKQNLLLPWFEVWQAEIELFANEFSKIFCRFFPWLSLHFDESAFASWQLKTVARDALWRNCSHSVLLSSIMTHLKTIVRNFLRATTA